MDAKGKNAAVSILIELAIYAVLIVAYFFLALHFLGDWLAEIYHRDRRIYAVTALFLIVGQGVLLETLTTALLRWIRSKRD
jgi:hypothetical protein